MYVLSHTQQLFYDQCNAFLSNHMPVREDVVKQKYNEKLCELMCEVYVAFEDMIKNRKHLRLGQMMIHIFNTWFWC